MQVVAKAFPGSKEVDVNFDDYASYGRFCDDDNPYHVVVEEGCRTEHDQWCLQRRFPPKKPQPEAFVVGRFRVVFVVSKSNPVQAMTFAGVRKALCEKGKKLRWEDIGQDGGTGKIRVFGVADNNWVRQLIQDRCMTRWRDTETPGSREQQRLALRDDIVGCIDAAEVIAKVRDHCTALGFFAIGSPLTERELQGVRFVPIATDENATPIAPSWEPDDAYPALLVPSSGTRRFHFVRCFLAGWLTAASMGEPLSKSGLFPLFQGLFVSAHFRQIPIGIAATTATAANLRCSFFPHVGKCENAA